jgi:glycosyltransferase involved in cell wall biosynthesis
VRIGLLSYEYPPETGFGGIGTYTWYHARALVRLGHEVHVLAGATDPTAFRSSEHDGVLVHRFHASGVLMRAFKGLGASRLWWTQRRLETALSMYQGMQVLMKAHKLDILEMPECGGEGALLNALTHTPTVVRLHSPAQMIMPFYEVRRADTVLCSWVEQQGLQRASAVSSCSRFLAREAEVNLRMPGPARVIPNGIDLSLFDRAEADRGSAPHIPRNRLCILFAGRMERRKGVHLCPEIAASILERFDVAFVFAGQDTFDYLRSTLVPYLASRTLKGSVHYAGHLPLAALRGLVCRTDIFLLPSLWENCPYSCLEAMAAGRAIVSSDQGGMPELIQHEENGLLARSGVASEFVRQLERLIESDALRRRLGVAARRTVEESFTDDRVARLSVELYQETGRSGISARSTPQRDPRSAASLR